VSITNFITITNGAANFTGNLNITATLQSNNVSFLTLTNPAFTASGGVTNLVWTSAALATNYTLPTTTTITYVITNNIAGTAFHVNYGSTNYSSEIVLPASTVIAFSGFAVYDAPYPNGNLVATPIAGTTLYVRASVTDPFGSNDITSLGLAFTAPSTNNNFNVTLTDTSVVFTNASTKVYEYVWNTGPATGNYTIAATANEGNEGVKANATASITTIYLDLGTPSITQFTYGNNGAVSTTRTATPMPPRWTLSPRPSVVPTVTWKISRSPRPARIPAFSPPASPQQRTPRRRLAAARLSRRLAPCSP
jgi:hypothetical protein